MTETNTNPDSTAPTDSVRISDRWSRRDWLKGTGAAVAGLTLAGCERLKNFRSPSIGLRGTLNILVWDGYFPEELFDQFESEFGYAVNYQTFESNEDLRIKLETGAVKADLVMPSAFAAKALATAELIKPFTPGKFVGFEAANPYIVPYIWGSTGIGYDCDRVMGLPKSWGALFALQAPPRIPDALRDFRPIDKVAMLDDARFTLGSALIYLGHDPNSLNEREIDAAGRVLAQARDRINYDSVDVPENLRTGAYGMVMAWTGDVTKALTGYPAAAPTLLNPQPKMLPGNKALRIALPREGSIVFMDSFALPASCENIGAAHNFVSFFMRPHVAAKVTNYSFYATTVDGATPYVDRYLINGPSFFIHPSGKNFNLKDVGEMDEYYRGVWEQLTGSYLSRPVAAPPAPAREIDDVNLT
jgi:spermidine/putrescine-binding protein